MIKKALCQRLAWFSAPPLLGLAMLAMGSDTESISGAVLAACAISYLLRPILRYELGGRARG